MAELALIPVDSVAPAGVPPEIISVCSLSDTSSRYWNSSRALAELKRDGLDGLVASAAATVRAALAPADPAWLRDRLVALGMMLTPNRGEAEATVWLAEMSRLLGDFPEDILGEAIDACVRCSRFLPTVAEIRARAEPVWVQRRRLYTQLDAIRRLIESGANVPPARPISEQRPASQPEQPMTAADWQEANLILERVGAATRYRDDGTRYMVERRDPASNRIRHEGPARMPTAADYVALGLTPEAAAAAVAERRPVDA